MQIFHIATAADWAAARRSGSYTTSTVGRTLAEEGFIHASRREQVAGVWKAFYAGVREPLVLLTIDTDRLTSRWHEDPVGDDTFPHIYGPIAPSAVVRAQPLDARGGTGSFTSVFAHEMGLRLGLAVVAMLLSVVGGVLGGRAAWEWGGFVGAVIGLVVGVTLI